jgi:hypothetical protein
LPPAQQAELAAFLVDEEGDLSLTFASITDPVVACGGASDESSATAALNALASLALRWSAAAALDERWQISEQTLLAAWDSLSVEQRQALEDTSPLGMSAAGPQAEAAQRAFELAATRAGWSGDRDDPLFEDLASYFTAVALQGHFEDKF